VTGSATRPAFVGRNPELATLLASLDDSAPSVPRVFTVIGEAGIGKSRLAHEFMGRAEARGARVLAGRCLDYESAGLPYGPLREGLASIIGTGSAEALFRGSGHADDPVDRQQLFQRVAVRVDGIAPSKPILLVIEDLHWSDRSTRDLLAHLAAVVANLRLVMTVRSEAAVPSGEVARFLVELELRGLAQRVVLGPLSDDEVGQQVAAVLGRPPEEALLDGIRRRAEGNPLYVEELTTAAAAGRGLALPPTLTDVLLVRVAELDDDVQQVLRMCAVGGRRIVHPLLRAVADSSDELLESALRVAIQRKLLRTEDDRHHDAYAFHHALVQETIYADLLPSERTRLHSRYAQVLAAQPSLIHDPALAAGEMARHFEAAHELSAARAAWLDAGRAAYQALALHEADACFARALAIPASEPQDRGGEVQVLAEASEIARAAGRFERAVELVRHAIALAPSDDFESRAGLQQRLSTALWEDGQAAAAEQASVESARLAESLPPSEGKARALISLASVELVLGFPERTLNSAQEAFDVAVQAGCEREAARSLAYVGPAQVATGKIRAGIDAARRAWERSRHTEDLDLLANTATHHMLCVGIGRGPASGLAVADELAAIAGRLGLPELAGTVEYARGNYLLALGRWAEAGEAYKLAASQDVSQPFVALPAVGRAILAASRGDFTVAQQQLQLATEATPATHQLSVALPIIRAEAILALARGDHAGAVATVERGLRHGMPGAWDMEQTPALLRIGLRAATELVRVHGTRRRQGATATAQSMRVAADTYARRLLDMLPPEAEQGSHHVAWRALITAERLRLDEADTPEDWYRAAEAAADAHLLPDRAYALLRHGEALARAARRPEAARALTEAHRLTSEIGARVLAAQVERLARRSRLQIVPTDATARRRRRSSRRVDELTDREREVLELVTAGHSNRQIAEALFVTEKTAGAHVSNILAKLGASSRGEAAAIAVRDQLLDS